MRILIIVVVLILMIITTQSPAQTFYRKKAKKAQRLNAKQHGAKIHLVKLRQKMQYAKKRRKVSRVKY